MDKMQKYWIDHIHLMSPDPVKTADFYEKMFGVKKVIRNLGNGRTTAILNLNGVTILISKPTGDAAQFGLSHFGIGTDNLETATEELKTKGVKFTQDIREIRPGFKISFLAAPEDVSIELQEGSM
jgi:predicted enzyme related to lactoylglutathione lyase